MKKYDAANYSVLKRFILFSRDFIIGLVRNYYNSVLGMRISKTARFSLKANFDKTNPKGVIIGDFTYVAFGAVIFTHDMTRSFHADTTIGTHCFIGANSIIMPGIVIGDHCVIGAGSVVTKDIPSHSIAAGNPAKIIKQNINTNQYGKII